MKNDSDTPNGSPVIFLDRDGSGACVGNRRVALGSHEFELLRLLVDARGGVVSVEALLHGVWQGEDGVAASRLRLTLARLRRKLGPRVDIETIVGEGYRLP